VFHFDQGECEVHKGKACSNPNCLSNVKYAAPRARAPRGNHQWIAAPRMPSCAPAAGGAVTPDHRRTSDARQACGAPPLAGRTSSAKTRT
jgi:hypothetical protein